ncbi:fungal-specific transcription factor domain-containing protein [Mycena vitilis]|nr:fungal-specific transcription factor domain-containing protein [Mycena vitilis]
MSSEDSSECRTQPKRRRLQGACDICRKKKIRCDSAENPGNKCSSCVFFKTQCTHLYTAKESSSSLSYGSAREHVAAILSQTTAYVPSTDPIVLFQILVDIAKYARNLEDLLAVSTSASVDSSSPSTDDSTSVNEEDGNDGVLVDLRITDPLRRLSLRAPFSGADDKHSFFGKSSSLNFIKAAMQYAEGASNMFEAQRPEFWALEPWQNPIRDPSPHPYSFPDNDILQNLIDIYFRHINPMVFLLHSQTFRAAVAEGKHLRDRTFGAVVLVVCALASRRSDDPEVLISSDAPVHSAGWKWFRQARPLQLAISSEISLSKLQLICRVRIGLGDVSRGDSQAPIVVDFSWPRNAFSPRDGRTSAESDTVLNSIFGRPSISTSEDYDVDMPTECDDEYLDEACGFQQPADKPALSAYMTSYLQLIVIFNRAHRDIYSVKRTESQTATVAELDSALNEWVASIPSHLRWDPNREGIFLDQSTALYMSYYHGTPHSSMSGPSTDSYTVQMLIHRPFIPTPGETPPAASSSFPSLAICANSARSCGHVMDVHSRRTGNILHQPHAHTALFDSALILLLNVWGGRRAVRSPSDIARAGADIKKCVDVLHLYEKRFPVAGRKCDLIAEIFNRGSGNIPGTTNPGLKRPAPQDEDCGSNTNAPSPDEQLEQLERSIKQTDHLFCLPLYTQELGLLPVYESFDFRFNLDPNQVPPVPTDIPDSEFAFLPVDACMAFDNDQTTFGANGYQSQQFNIPPAPSSNFSNCSATAQPEDSGATYRQDRSLMSSESTEATAPKRRRIQGACDLCKKKKIRCDRSQMPGNKCTNCITAKANCTHIYLSKEQDGPSLNYKNSREHVAAILSKTTAYIPPEDPQALYRILVDIAKYARNLEELMAVSSSTLDLISFSDAEDKRTTGCPALDVSNDVDGVFVDSRIIEPMSRLALHAPSSESHIFFGKSSSVNFIKAAMEDGPGETFEAQRPEFWTSQPWHPTPEPLPQQSFPDDDLLQNLIDLYFEQINPILFLLHSPTFRASVADGEHLRDRHFGAVVLAVCALASRASDDPRVLMSPDAPRHSAGWKWFDQTRPLQLITSSEPSGSKSRQLFNLQLICLSVLFLPARQSWILCNLGIRTAQEIGAHRRSRYSSGSKAEQEMLKRAFWTLLSMDTLINVLFGRPTVSTAEDYDAEMPTECDDEYWGEPYNFQQPPNTPALTAYATPYLRLMVIFNRAYRAIYSIKRERGSEPAILAELDSALNKWVDSIPDHLRWDPNREGIFLDQSASLYLTYYQIQILIHRPFIAAPGETAPTDSAFPSLAICANSARSCGHVMEVQSRRNGNILHYPYAITALFDSAVILLLNVWGGRRTPSPSDIPRAVADIKKCVDVLHLYEKWYPVAGRHWCLNHFGILGRRSDTWCSDLITELLDRASQNAPLGNSPRPSLKRPVPEDDEDNRSRISHFPAATAIQQLEQLEHSMQQTNHLFTLPLYTQELGVLPIYESFDFQFNFQSSFNLSSSSAEAYPIGPEHSGQVSVDDDPGQFIGSQAAHSWQEWSEYAGHEHSH